MLDTAPDLELIKNVKENNDSDSFLELSKRHTALCQNIYNKYASSMVSSGICVDDVREEKDYVMLKAIQSYEPDKNVKFSTWLGNNVRFQCLNYITAQGKYINMEEDNLIRLADEKHNAEVNVDDFNKEYIFSILEQLSDKRINKIFQLRYFENNKKTSWATIGQIMNISTQTAINLHKKGITILNNKIKSKNFFDNV